MATPRVFVSHSHHDNDYCREFVAALRERGYQVWYDEHNLGWGALRPTIEKEMPQCQHFIAIFSPDAVASDWVNAEIDAALDLLKDGVLQTITFVVARECVVPLLLRRWKRIEGANNVSVPAREAAGRAAAILRGATPSPVPSMTSTLDAPAPVTAQPIRKSAPVVAQLIPEPASIAAPQILPPSRFPLRLAHLGFTANKRNGDAYITPPVCEIPEGEFLMGSDPLRDVRAESDEQPQHRVKLSAFAIARFPVTVAEYACFVESANYRQPSDWQNQMQKLDHPVVYVSWDDAHAYTDWLAKVSGQARDEVVHFTTWLKQVTEQRWQLPTEAQWEKAARGTDGRIYPWGGIFDAKHCNTGESGIRGTTSVGNYPTGTSPYGVEEMVGNVREWTTTGYQPRPDLDYPNYSYYYHTSGRDRIVLRGGSWKSYSRITRLAYRHHLRQDDLYNDVGFRLALA